MATATRRSPSVAVTNIMLDANNFPLKSMSDVVQFFKRSLELYEQQGIEPDLTLLSIVVGFIELSLTTGEAAQAAVEAASTQLPVAVSHSIVGITGNNLGAATSEIITAKTVPFPVITYEIVSSLYKKFQSILSLVDKPKQSAGKATRDVIKKVSDIIYHSLMRSTYKDRAHLQNLYSYLSGNKLDSFGVTLAVVAGCQLLGYKEVHLAIAEDHAWCVFGGKKLETIEVSWHGKLHEDKRGQDVNGGVESGSWLYLGGRAVICSSREMEVAAIVAAINTSLTVNSDCLEVEDLQRQLLWLLYDMGHLKKYPMALGTLGELEEISSTTNRPSCEQIYRQAIDSARHYYGNQHVYPYTYQANFYHRLIKYREAFGSWANAADVIRLYTYSCRDDEEIYKELLDIANEMIPAVIKTESSGHSARSILRDPEVFANLLRFYDGICQWEEDSLTPILHIGWAKPLVNNITKFDYDVRSQVVIHTPEEEIKQRNQNIETLKDGSVSQVVEGNNNLIKREEKENKKLEMPTTIATTIADLTAACGQKILNPDFLLKGGEQPFAEEASNESINQSNSLKNNGNNNHNGFKINNTTTPKSSDTKLAESSTSNASLIGPIFTHSVAPEEEEVAPFEFLLKRPIITLYSQKMKGLKDLLLAEKLNTQAISLQVTAQSVASKKIRGIDKLGHQTSHSIYASVNVADTAINCDSIAASRPKRTRRE